MTTEKQFIDAARAFVRAYVKTGRQWDTMTIASYLPEGLRLRNDAAYAGPATIADIAAFMREEARYPR